MPRCVNQVETVNLTIFSLVVQRSSLRLDRNATFLFDIHRVQNLRFHLTVGQATAPLNQTIRQRGLTMVNMGDDRKVAYVLHGIPFSSLWLASSAL